MTHCFGIKARLRAVFVNMPILALIGGPVTIVVAAQDGIPGYAVMIFVVMAFATGLGTTLGFHRLFSHRSFATSDPVEWLLMVLGCMAGQNSPFYWVATHRTHHAHSDHDGDPHSPYVWAGRRLRLLPGFWHSYFGWLLDSAYDYPKSMVKDLAARPGLVWIDRHWFGLYLAGLAIPAFVGLIIGGTAYDAFIGFLWGGPFRQFVALQITFAVNSICHLWGTRPYATADGSRNNLFLGVIAFGDGWHNNHHAFPYSARHGFHWWQPDLTWSVIRLMECAGLVWQVKRPNFLQPSMSQDGGNRPSAGEPSDSRR